MSRQQFNATGPGDTIVTHAIINRALLYMAQNVSEEISIDDLAGASGVSKFSLCRLFKRYYGISPIKLLWTFRALLAAELMELAPFLSLTDIAFQCGFTSSAHFSRFMRKTFKSSPSKMRDHYNVAPETVGSSKIDSIKAIYASDQQKFITVLKRTLTSIREKKESRLVKTPASYT